MRGCECVNECVGDLWLPHTGQPVITDWNSLTLWSHARQPLTMLGACLQVLQEPSPPGTPLHSQARLTLCTPTHAHAHTQDLPWSALSVARGHVDRSAQLPGGLRTAPTSLTSWNSLWL